MANPFLRRATEFFREDSAFLSVVSPEPMKAYLAKYGKDNLLLDMPVRIIGNPGSGKTMMASLLEFRLVETILRDPNNEERKTLAAALAECNFTDGKIPLITATRLPMESEYRDFWELPYDDEIKTKLVYSLIQARSILGWIRNITANKRRKLSDIQFKFRERGQAQLEQIGGPTIEGILERAREVERDIYSIGARLIPPEIKDISETAITPYQPFETILEIKASWGNQVISMRPLVILDDAHTLHPEQFDQLFRSITRREICVGRWLMMRLDALPPSTVLRSEDNDQIPGLKSDRDFIDIYMQSDNDRNQDRKQFRKMATDMANRYLSRFEPLASRGHKRLRNLLMYNVQTLPQGKLDRLNKILVSDQRDLKIVNNRVLKIKSLVRAYFNGVSSPSSNSKPADIDEAVELGMVHILLNRYAVRITLQEPDLFDNNDPEPRTSLKADSSVADAARIFLHHKFNRALHYGIEDVCDASNENAELFLQLAGSLVSLMETQVISKDDPALEPKRQQAELKKTATEIINKWSFPYARMVRSLTDAISKACIDETLKPNAPLGPGANAIAILEEEIQPLLKDDQQTARVLKFAFAYGAINAIRRYGQGGKIWCLLELSGPVCLSKGLTLKRGGFLPRTANQLVQLIEKASV